MSGLGEATVKFLDGTTDEPLSREVGSEECLAEMGRRTVDGSVMPSPIDVHVNRPTRRSTTLWSRSTHPIARRSTVVRRSTPREES